jgi:ribosome-binding protein aMBF1 (putative translation factor)
MVGIQEVECEFCGAIIPLSKAIKINMETGEIKYACPACAERWGKKMGQPILTR